MKKTLTLLLLVMVSVITAQWKDLTLADVFKKKSLFEFASISEWHWLPDTDEYISFMDTTTNIRSLYNYNLVTGDTSLFLARDKFVYDNKNLKIVDYTINAKSNKILLVTEQHRIWRHSRSAIYYLYDMNNSSVKQVADGIRLRNVKFSPDGKSIAYIKSDNNLYIFRLDINMEVRLTKDGSFNILNGHFGWVYEEEFGSYDAYRWSPDSKFIAFVREDQTNVKQFPMMDELVLYPKIYWHHYPKVGENNPVLKIGIVNIKLMELSGWI